MSTRPKIWIRIDEIIRDIRSRASESDLMIKYGLSSRGLQTAFRKLIEARAIAYEEICGRSGDYEDTCEVVDGRRWPRNYVVFELPVVEAGDRANHGWVRDMTERGLRVHGIKTSPGSVMLLTIIPEGLGDFLPFTLESRCQWFSEQSEDRHAAAGLKISKISGEGLEQLRRLIDFMTVVF